MNNIKVLEMINDGRIDELKVMLQDEIYTDELKKCPGAKERYSAMKKYFSYTKSTIERLTRPCQVEFEGEKQTAFSNSFSLVLTTESAGGIELFDDPDKYLDVNRIVNYNGDESVVDISKIIAEAKSMGYKPKRQEVDQGHDYKYVLKYNDIYYKIGLLDISYGIINNGGKVSVWQVKNRISPLTIKNEIGTCIILPVNYNKDSELHDIKVLEIA